MALAGTWLVYEESALPCLALTPVEWLPLHLTREGPAVGFGSPEGGSEATWDLLPVLALCPQAVEPLLPLGVSGSRLCQEEVGPGRRSCELSALQSLCVWWVSQALSITERQAAPSPQANWSEVSFQGTCLLTRAARPPHPQHTLLAVPVAPSTLQSYRAGRGGTSGIPN